MNTMENRKFVIGLIIALVGLTFLIRLFYVQVVTDKYMLSSLNNSRKRITQYPARGMVTDVKGELLVYNQAAYDLMVIPRRVKDIDTAAFCAILNIDQEAYIKNLEKARAHSYRRPSVFLSEISAEDYGNLQEQLYKFKGFYVQTRTLRKYPQSTAPHLLGYISEVNQTIIDKNPYYKSGDNIGRSGIEKAYEQELRGTKGVKFILVDVYNREKGPFREGRYDTLAITGQDLQLTIDAKLQAYGEQLMQNKKGSIVAIDPRTGGILTLISKPDFDPNLLVGRVRSANYRMLNNDTLKPLFNRALMANYPPGSTFKLINALIGMQEGVLTPGTHYSCNYGYHVRGLSMGCHAHRSPVDLEYSIQTSCNAYYSNVFRSIIDKYPTAEEGFDVWRDHVAGFGLGDRLGIDLPGELRGNLPATSYYDKYYGSGRWSSLTVVSLAIGQGELGITPVQMANMGAILANRGHYFTPHVLHSTTFPGGASFDYNAARHNTKIDTSHFRPVVDAMEQVVERGTGVSAKIPGIAVCGKTGTVENPHGDDHSTFLAFAPKDDPEIVISVYVENGVWGSRWAAPIAGLMIEKYLTDSISRPHIEERMLNGNLINPE